AVPRSVTSEELYQVHDKDYVDAVRTGYPRCLACSQGFEWDEGFWRMACATTGGVVDAALSALNDGVAGTLSSGIHHARYERGAGFCTFNGLALACVEARKRVNRVLIIDLDAHCGGGTNSLIREMPGVYQFDVSTSSFDAYDDSEHGELHCVQSATEYLSVLRNGLAHLDKRPAFDLVLYNAGMDPFNSGSEGDAVTEGVLRERDEMVFQWCRCRGIPAAFTLAGGYTGYRMGMPDLVGLHRITIETAVRFTIDGRRSR
ncbi:MAG: hypothetical protein GYA63_00270, partial [Armatimonadetes bacterium]|nr:hypothetical protein [Armatimonadota bacterium]